MPHLPLPESLAGRSFSVADGCAAGLGERRMYAADLARPTHGVRSAGSLESLEDLCRATLVGLPDDVAFSHQTAARLIDLPLPTRHESGPLHVMRSSSQARIRRVGCEHHKGLESRATAELHGLRVVGACDTWCDLGDVLVLDDLVVLGDQVARRLQSVDALAEVLSRKVRQRGARNLREALQWIRVGSDSPMETRCRLLFVRSGLPEPALNLRISDTGGGFLCRADFVWEKQRVIGEYQGAAHFGDFERGDDDISRRLLAEDEHWKYIEVTKKDCFNAGRRHQLLQRLGRYLGVQPLPGGV